MRLIDADALLESVDKERQYLIARGQKGAEHILVHNFRNLIDNAPTVERKPFATVTFDKDELERIVDERVIEPIKNGELVIKEERPTGHWIIEECSLGKTYYCSECYAHQEVCFDFCPYCGAEMRKEAEK